MSGGTGADGHVPLRVASYNIHTQRDDTVALAQVVREIAPDVLIVQEGPRRFNQLIERLPGIAPNILSSRLKKLEEDGIVLGRYYQERPPRAAYQLTAPGRDLAGALRLLTAWGARHSPDAEPPRHDLCGTPLETRWHCPTCDRTLSDYMPESDLRHL